jgi:hypothetical protein
MKFDSDVILTTEEYKEYLELKNKYVWHDAVKEPPKEDGYYIGYWLSTIKGWEKCKFEKGFWWGYGKKGWFMFLVPPEFYMPLPLPPERSGE